MGGRHPVISWAAGDDLGRCASSAELGDLVAAGDCAGGLDFHVRVPGAIGVDNNATFSEVGGFCVNEVAGCDWNARPDVDC